jgi:HEAT repeat protein
MTSLPLARRAYAGALLGAGAFGAGALLDLVFAHDALTGAGDLARFAVTLLGLMGLAGAVLGALCGVLRPWLGSRPGLGGIAAAVGAMLGWQLCSGVWIARHMRPWTGAVVLGAAAVPAALLAVRLAGRTGTRARAAPIWIAAGLLLYLVDAHVYRPLYWAAHLALFGGYSLCFALAMAALRPPRCRWGTAALLAIVVAAGFGAWTLARRPGVRFAALERTNASRKVIAALPLPGGPRERASFLRQAGPTGPSASQAAEAPSDTDAPAGLSGAHIVLVTIDTLRADRLGMVRDGVSLTPHLDDVAQGAVRFERAYAQAPHSSFSLASLHTSDYVHSTIDLRDRLPPTLAEILAARGYRTSALYTNGIFFTGREKVDAFARSRFGFARAAVLDMEAPELTNAAIDEIARIRAEGEPPTFLWVHYFDVHEPYVHRKEFDHGTRSIDLYDSEVGFTDREVGRLIAALAQLERPTVLCITADHGEEFKEHGGVYHGSTLYEEQVRVPLLIAAPGLRPRVVPDPVELVDVAPTLLRMVGVEPPPSMRGDDLGDLIAGRARAGPVFSEVDTKKMVVRDNYKLIHDFRLSTWELYDLHADPHERNNLYERAPAVAEDLRAELGRWFDRIEQSVAGEGMRPAAIDLGRMGDRRAVPMLEALIADAGAAVAHRAEAARLLGRLQDRSALPALWKALGSAPPEAADEVAIAIGELFDQRGRGPLGTVLQRPDATIRARAAIALAKLGDRRAAAPLLEALGDPNFDIRRRAVHYLGMVGGGEAIGPLLELAVDPRLRYLCTLALGRIGGRTHDGRVLPFLREKLTGDEFADVRGYATVALGYLGDPRAIPELARALREEPEIKWTAETLVRLGAVGHEVPGSDFATVDRARGVGPCHRSSDPSVDAYLGATWCELQAPGARVSFSVREPDDYVVLLRARALVPELIDQPLTMVLNGEPLPSVQLETSWEEFRVPTTPDRWKRGRNEVVFHFPGTVGVGTAEGRVGVDHLVLASGRIPEARER